MVDCQDEQAKSSSQSNEKIKSHTLSFKLLVVKHAKMSSTGAAERKFEVNRKTIIKWIQNKSKIQNKVSSKNWGSFAKKLDGGGRKIKDIDLEEMLLWMDNFTKIKELTSVTEAYSKESQDIWRGKSC